MATNIDHLITVRGVYDGWSIAVLDEPYRYVNRWATYDDPTKPEPGCERRFAAVEEYINESGVQRGCRNEVVWR